MVRQAEHLLKGWECSSIEPLLHKFSFSSGTFQSALLCTCIGGHRPSKAESSAVPRCCLTPGSESKGFLESKELRSAPAQAGIRSWREPRKRRNPSCACVRSPALRKPEPFAPGSRSSSVSPLMHQAPSLSPFPPLCCSVNLLLNLFCLLS